jgi:hypothetical protein
MARFYADIQGNRGGASRMGTTDSGIEGHIRGWSIGVRVTCRAIDQGKHEFDECIAYATGGSNSSWRDKEIWRGTYPNIENPKWKWEKKE